MYIHKYFHYFAFVLKQCGGSSLKIGQAFHHAVSRYYMAGFFYLGSMQPIKRWIAECMGKEDRDRGHLQQLQSIFHSTTMTSKLRFTTTYHHMWRRMLVRTGLHFAAGVDFVSSGRDLRRPNFHRLYVHIERLDSWLWLRSNRTWLHI